MFPPYIQSFANKKNPTHNNVREFFFDRDQAGLRVKGMKGGAKYMTILKNKPVRRSKRLESSSEVCLPIGQQT